MSSGFEKLLWNSCPSRFLGGRGARGGGVDSDAQMTLL